ncbi:MAG: GNAT family N-acetyltransferase [Candidatus Velthaea sp.]|jgi:GNAT superfamily N-acetyltransferase
MVAPPIIPGISIRVAEPADAAAIVRFMCGLSQTSRHLRFFGMLSDPAIVAETLEEIGGSGAISMIAVHEDSADVVGHAIVIPEREGPAELAVAVADAYQNHQIGTLLVEAVMRGAREVGVQEIRADVLAGNHRMLDIFAREGYVLAADWGSGIVHATAAPPRI